ncbi:hydroxylysine kinase-like isoform X2 [Asterias amurensis]|uniref:hydroxylysine kinase-like isoform X2 n=1 Tax=Asterias amurensis TaxID=7602 RepID=UPI003AB2FEEC
MTDNESVNKVKLRRSCKPLLSIDDVKVLLQRLFGLRASEIQEFPSYYDRIYYVKTDPNQGIGEQNEFSFKVLNSEFTAEGAVETQTDILDFLQSTFPELKCQAPLLNKNNSLLSYEPIKTKLESVEEVCRLTTVTAVRLFSFLPGKPLLKLAPLPPPFFQKVGKHLGNLQNALQYPYDVREDSDNIWCLDKVPHLKHYLWVINDAKKLRIVEDVISEYERKVIPVRGEFRRGVVHQDCNHSNILAVPSLEVNAKKSQTPRDYNVSGIIDFDFTATSFLVYEIAIPMMYLMFCSDEPLEATANLLAGFESRAPLQEKERGVLRVLIAGRFIQSLVLGLYFASLNPDNSYISESQVEGWNLLELFLNQSEDDQLKLWGKFRRNVFV